MSRLQWVCLIVIICLLLGCGAWIWHRERLDCELAESFAAEVLRVDSSNQPRELKWKEARTRLASARGVSAESLTGKLQRFAEADPLGQPRRGRNGALADLVLQHWTAAIRHAQEAAAKHSSFASHDLVGRIAFAWGEFERAREALTAALQQSDGTALARAATQVRLAELEMSAGHSDAAQSLIGQALGVLNDPAHESVPALGRALDLAMQGTSGDLEGFARRRINQLERQGQLENPEAIEPLNVIARARLSAGRDEEATVLLERAARIARRHQISSRSAAICLGTLGELRRRAKRLPDAEQLLMDAIGMMEIAHGGDSVEMSRLLQSLGTAQRDLGRKAEAVQHLERALRIQQNDGKLLVAEPEHAELLDVLGDVYLSLRRYQEAERATQRAFDILQEKALIDTPERCKVAAHLGVILMEMNRPEDAEPYLRRANAVVSRHPAAVDRDFSSTVGTWMAQCMARQGLTEEAEEMLRQLGSVRR